MNYFIREKSFNADFAREYGVNSAVLVGEIERFIDFDKSSGTCRFYDNRYWVPIFIKTFHDILYYLDYESVCDVLLDCEENNLLVIRRRFDEFETKWDKNKIWVAFGDEMSQYSDINKYEERKKVSSDRYSGNKNFVKERDKNRCSICGSAEHIVVHHIDGYNPEKPENNKANKLIVLCRNCHNKVHAKSAEKKIMIPKEQLDRIGYFD